MEQAQTPSHLVIAFVTVSDRASRGEYEDKTFPMLLDFLSQKLKNPWQEEYHLIPDDQHSLESLLCSLVDEKGIPLILTTGGTGPSPRDITPEVTQKVCHKLLPGFGEAMRLLSFSKVPTSILSRQVSGIRNRSLIVNLPGSPKGALECLELVLPAISDCLTLLGHPPLLLEGFTSPHL